MIKNLNTQIIHYFKTYCANRDYDAYRGLLLKLELSGALSEPVCLILTALIEAADGHQQIAIDYLEMAESVMSSSRQRALAAQARDILLCKQDIHVSLCKQDLIVRTGIDIRVHWGVPESHDAFEVRVGHSEWLVAGDGDCPDESFAPTVPNTECGNRIIPAYFQGDSGHVVGGFELLVLPIVWQLSPDKPKQRLIGFNRYDQLSTSGMWTASRLQRGVQQTVLDMEIGVDHEVWARFRSTEEMALGLLSSWTRTPLAAD